MRRYLIFMSTCILFIGINYEVINSKTQALEYRIYMDSKTINSYDKKMEVFNVLNMLCENVDENSYYVLVKDNLYLFEEIKDCEVTFKNSKLFIYYGDSKGAYIEGVYTYRDTCFSEEVEVRSSIFDFLFK